MTHSYPWSRVLIFFNRSHESNEHIPFATSEARLSLMADIWSSVNTLLIRSKSDSSISSLTRIKYFEGSGLKYSGAWVLRKNSSQTKFPLRSHSLWWSHAWLLSTVDRHIFVHMIFVASFFDAIYFMFKSYYIGRNLYQKKALLI